MEITKAKVGRPKGSKSRLLTPETVNLIAHGIREGMTYKAAALNAGVAESTFHLWMKKAKETRRSPYLDLLEQVQAAEQIAKINYLKMVKLLAQGETTVTKTTIKRDHAGEVIGSVEVTETVPPNLQASMWFLERRFPEEFAPKHLLALTNGKNPFNVSLFGQALLGSARKE